LSGKEDKDLAELPMTPVSKRKTPAKKASTAAASTKKADADADATTTKKVEKKKMDDDAKTPASKKEKEGTAKAKKPLPATSEKQSSKKGKDDASSKEKAATTTAPTMGDIAAKEKRKRDEIQQSQQQQQQQHEHHHHNHHHGNKKKKKQQTQVQIERGLEKKKKKKSKKARKREREALAAKEAGEDGNAAKKTKITPTTTETAVNGTTKWSFGDWTCRKCGAHNYRKQKDKCFRCSYPKAIETNMKQGNHAAREYLKGKLKDDKNWTFSNQEHEWCVRNASFDPLMKDEVYDLFLKYLEKVEAKHRDRVRDGANAVIERMKRALSVLEKFPTHEEEKDAKRAIFTEGLSGPDGEKKKKKKKRNRKKKKKDKDEEAPEKSAGVEGKESEEAKK
jgi:ribosomal protein L37E